VSLAVVAMKKTAAFALFLLKSGTRGVFVLARVLVGCGLLVGFTRLVSVSDDEACLVSRINSLKEPGLHLECVVHREGAQNHFSCGAWVHTDPVLRLHTSTVALAAFVTNHQLLLLTTCP